MNSTRRKRFLGIILLLSFVFLGWATTPSEAASDSLQVAVKAILPENQASDVTYFDLNMEPGKKQDLDLELTNSSDEEQTVTLEITNATTNSTGSIDYSPRGKDYKQDDTLKYPLTKIVSAPKTVTVPAKGTTTTKLTVNMPAESFDGIILGAVRVSLPEEKENSKDKSDSKNGVMIKNQIAYSVGIKLQVTETEVKADLDLLKVSAGQVAGRNAVLATIQNSQPTVLEDITYSAQVYQDGKSEVLHEAKVEGYRFAPNSHFDYVISWEGQPFRAGDYRLKMTADSKKTGQHWEWDKKFTIKAEEAKRLNEKAIDLDKDNTLRNIIIAAVLLLLLILLIILFIYLRRRVDRRRQAERKQKSRNKSKKKRSSKHKS